MSNGIGLCGLGSSPYGFGVPSQVNSSVARLWIKSDGTQGNCAKIDPRTGDYVLDANGNSVGDDSVNQMVYLALKTLKNTSAVSGFGLDLQLTNAVVTTGLYQRVKLAVFRAVKHLTDSGVISIVQVDVYRVTPTGLEVHIQWRNNSTGEINEFTF